MVTLSRVITSCGGTSSVTVRRSIRTERSRTGMTKITPGPRNGVSRPRRKTTARSYSFRILSPLSRMATPITMIIPNAGPMHSPPRASLCGALFVGAYFDFQPAHRHYARPRSDLEPLAAHCAPVLAMDEDAAGRARRDCLAHLADFSDQALAAGGGSPPPFTQDDPAQAEDDRAHRHRRPGNHTAIHLEIGLGAVE